MPTDSKLGLVAGVAAVVLAAVVYFPKPAPPTPASVPSPAPTVIPVPVPAATPVPSAAAERDGVTAAVASYRR